MAQSPYLHIDEFDLMGALTALGATGKPEEITKIHTAGQLATPVIAAVGLGPDPRTAGSGADRRGGRDGWRRAAGLPGKAAPRGRRRRA